MEQPSTTHQFGSSKVGRREQGQRHKHLALSGQLWQDRQNRRYGGRGTTFPVLGTCTVATGWCGRRVSLQNRLGKGRFTSRNLAIQVNGRQSGFVHVRVHGVHFHYQSIESVFLKANANRLVVDLCNSICVQPGCTRLANRQKRNVEKKQLTKNNKHRLRVQLTTTIESNSTETNS